jgi:hypothetical protein
VTVVLYGCEPHSLTLRDEHRLRVFENGGLEEYLDLKGRKLQEAGENYTCMLMSFIICTPHQILV